MMKTRLKLDESKALLDFLNLLEKSSEGCMEAKEITEHGAFDEIKLDVVEEKVVEKENAGIMSWFVPQFILDLGKPSSKLCLGLSISMRTGNNMLLGLLIFRHGAGSQAFHPLQLENHATDRRE